MEVKDELISKRSKKNRSNFCHHHCTLTARKTTIIEVRKRKRKEKKEGVRKA